MPSAFSILKILLLTVVSFVAICPMALCAPQKPKVPIAPKSTKTVWKLKYASGPYTGGETTIYLAPAAMKLTTLSSYEIYAKAPDWNATIYNLKTHCMCPLSKEEYMKGHMFFESEDCKNDFDPAYAFAKESISLYGFSAQRLSWHTIDDEKNFYRIRKKPEKVITQLCTTTQIPANPMQIGLIGAWAPIPHLKAVPLVFVDKHKDGRLEGRFYVTKIEQVTLPPSAFRPPAGYRKLRRTSQLFAEEYSGFVKEFMNTTDKDYEKPAQKK